MTVTVEAFFDVSSPWTRIAFHNVCQWAKHSDARVCWRPFLVGGVFNAVNDTVYASRARPNDPKYRLTFVWLKEWAQLASVPMNFPSKHHPLKAVQVMRFCCALADDQELLVRFSKAAFDAYFADQRNLDDVSELVAIANECGLPGDDLRQRSTWQEIKDQLRANTQEAIDRGAFGSPTFFVDGKSMYFGNDQLPLVYQRVASLAKGGRPAEQASA